MDNHDHTVKRDVRSQPSAGKSAVKAADTKGPGHAPDTAALSDSQYVLSFAPLVEFLGVALGPTVEVVLHDVANLDASVVAIANGEVSGRKVGSPATDLMLRVLRAGEGNSEPYLAGYRAKTANSASHLRSATYFLRREGKIVGMLCINADLSLLKGLENLVAKMSENYLELASDPLKSNQPLRSETLSTSISEATAGAISRALSTRPVGPEYFTAEDRQEVVKELAEEGFFQFKGAVSELAVAMGVSEPSVYRYLKQVR